jgi:hypothetical protein
MVALTKSATAEQRQMDDGFIDTQGSTVTPAEAHPVVAAESRGGVHGIFRLGHL